VNPFRNEHSIAGACQVRGRGYWSGRDVQVTMHPAAAGTGIRFVRTDLPGSPECLVASHHRVETHLRTNFRCGAASIQMAEHLLAALYAFEIDNCVIEIDAEELPGLDGSSYPYCEALERAGLTIQAAPRRSLVIDHAFRVESEGRWIEATPALHGETYFEYRLDFDQPGPITAQTFGLVLNPKSFEKHVAPARTFVTESQADLLRSQGVARHVTNKELLVFGDTGPIDNELRFDDECARHKALDLIGDLAVSGVHLIGRFISHRGGHVMNGAMAEILSKLAEQQRASTADRTTTGFTWNRAA